MNLQNKKCVPCEGGVPPLSEEQAETLRRELGPAWHLTPNHQLRQVFVFKDFAVAMVFVNRVAELAEAEGHHPDISVNYNKVTLTLTTHAIGGLSENDFILAAKVDGLDRGK